MTTSEKNWLDVTQCILTAVGLVPVVGSAADVINCGISLGRAFSEDVPANRARFYTDAAVSVACALPGLGTIAGAAKLGRVALKATAASRVAAVGKIAETATADVVKAARQMRSLCGRSLPQATSVAVTALHVAGNATRGAISRMATRRIVLHGGAKTASAVNRGVRSFVSKRLPGGGTLVAVADHLHAAQKTFGIGVGVLQAGQGVALTVHDAATNEATAHTALSLSNRLGVVLRYAEGGRIFTGLILRGQYAPQQVRRALQQLGRRGSGVTWRGFIGSSVDVMRDGFQGLEAVAQAGQMLAVANGTAPAPSGYASYKNVGQIARSSGKALACIDDWRRVTTRRGGPGMVSFANLERLIASTTSTADVLRDAANLIGHIDGAANATTKLVGGDAAQVYRFGKFAAGMFRVGHETRRRFSSTASAEPWSLRIDEDVSYKDKVADGFFNASDLAYFADGQHDTRAHFAPSAFRRKAQTELFGSLLTRRPGTWKGETGRIKGEIIFPAVDQGWAGSRDVGGDGVTRTHPHAEAAVVAAPMPAPQQEQSGPAVSGPVAPVRIPGPSVITAPTTTVPWATGDSAWIAAMAGSKVLPAGRSAVDSVHAPIRRHGVDGRGRTVGVVEFNARVDVVRRHALVADAAKAPAESHPQPTPQR